MGQKMNSYFFRKDYLWGAKDTYLPDGANYAKNIENCLKIREFISKYLPKELYADANIVSSGKVYIVTINTHKGSEVGEKIEKLQQGLSRKLACAVEVKIKNIDYPECNPIIIARKIGTLMEQRKDIKFAMKTIILESLRTCQGISIICYGRMGSDKAKIVKKKKGNIPLQSIDAYIESHIEHVRTKTGINSVRVHVLTKRLEERKISINRRNIENGINF